MLVSAAVAAAVPLVVETRAWGLPVQSIDSAISGVCKAQTASDPDSIATIDMVSSADQGDAVAVHGGMNIAPISWDTASARQGGGSPTLSGSHSEVAQSSPVSYGADGVHFGLFVDDYSHHYWGLYVIYDNDTQITPGQPLQRLKLVSAAGKFQTANLNTFGFDLVTNTPTLIDVARVSGSITDGYFLGDILEPYLSITEMAQDLTIGWQVQGGGVVLHSAYLIIESEPTTVGIVGIPAMGLLARRR